MRLSHSHSRKLSDLLLELYEPADLQTLRRRTLKSLAAAFGNQMVCHNEIGPTGSLSVLRPEIADFEPLRQAFFRHAHEHPSVAHLQRTRDAEAVKTSAARCGSEVGLRGCARATGARCAVISDNPAVRSVRSAIPRPPA